MKFINKNSFILIAMMGWPFCRATKNALILLVKNVRQVRKLLCVFVLRVLCYVMCDACWVLSVACWMLGAVR